MLSPTCTSSHKLTHSPTISGSRETAWFPGPPGRKIWWLAGYSIVHEGALQWWRAVVTRFSYTKGLLSSIEISTGSWGGAVVMANNTRSIPSSTTLDLRPMFSIRHEMKPPKGWCLVLACPYGQHSHVILGFTPLRNVSSSGCHIDRGAKNRSMQAAGGPKQFWPAVPCASRKAKEPANASVVSRLSNKSLRVSQSRAVGLALTTFP